MKKYVINQVFGLWMIWLWRHRIFGKMNKMKNLFPNCFLFSSCIVVIINIANLARNSHCGWPHNTEVLGYIWLEIFCFEDENYWNGNHGWVSSEVLGMDQLVPQCHDKAWNASDSCPMRWTHAVQRGWVISFHSNLKLSIYKGSSEMLTSNLAFKQGNYYKNS